MYTDGFCRFVADSCHWRFKSERLLSTHKRQIERDWLGYFYELYGYILPCPGASVRHGKDELNYLNTF